MAPHAAESAAAHAAGLLLVVGSSLLFSAMSLCVVLIAREPPPATPVLQVVLSRFVLQFVLTPPAIAAFAAARGDCARLRVASSWLGQPRNRVKLLVRGGWGIFGLSCFFLSLSSLPIADATAITFTNVPLSALFARLFLKEPYTFADAATAALAMVGVLLVAQPTSIFPPSEGGGQEAPVGAVLVALAGSCFSAMAYISARAIGPGEDALVLVLYFAALGCITVPFACLATGAFVPPTSTSMLLQLAAGVTGWAGQVFLNAGLQRAPAGPAVVMRYCDLVIALVVQATVFANPPNALKVLGCLLVMSTVVSTLYKAHAKSKAAAASAAAAAVPPTGSPLPLLDAPSVPLASALHDPAGALGASWDADDPKSGAPYVAGTLFAEGASK